MKYLAIALVCVALGGCAALGQENNMDSSVSNDCGGKPNVDGTEEKLMQDDDKEVGY